MDVDVVMVVVGIMVMEGILNRYHGTRDNNSTHKGKTSMHHQKWNNIEAKQEQNTPSKRSMRRIRLPRAMRIYVIDVV